MAGNRKLQYIITLKDEFTKTLGKVKTSVASLASSAKAFFAPGVKLAGITALAGSTAMIAGATGFAVLAKKIFDLNDDLGKSADRLGITTQELSALRHAADLSGIEVGDLDRMIRVMLTNLSDASAGKKVPTDLFEKLGLSVEKLRGMSVGNAFQEIIAGLQKVREEDDRVTLAMDVFGRTGALALNLTADGIRDARKEAELFGISIDRVTAQKMENINDNITRLQTALKGASTVVVTQFTPGIEQLSQKVGEFSKSGQLKLWALQTAQTMAIGFQGVLRILGYLGEALVGVSRIFNELRSQSAQFFGGLAAVRVEALESQIKDAEKLLTGVEAKIKAGTASQFDLDMKARITTNLPELQNSLINYRAIADAAVNTYESAEEMAGKLAGAQGAFNIKAQEAVEFLDKQIVDIKKQIAEQENLVKANIDVAKSSAEIKENTFQAAQMMDYYSERTKEAIRQTQLLIEKSRQMRQTPPEGAYVLSNQDLYRAERTE